MGKRSTRHQADIIAVGSELLHGGRVESNSLFLADQLAQCGFAVRQKVAVGDGIQDIQGAIRSSLNKVKIILMTGGLGSTLDDCTREAIADLGGRRLVRRKAAYDDIQARYDWLGRTITPLVAQQALLPVGATLLRNSVGTAAGFCVREKNVLIFALPGVSREAHTMMEAQVCPIIQKTWPNPPQYLSHVFNTFGFPETEIEVQLKPVLESDLQNHPVQFGLLASPLGVTVTVNCWLPSVGTPRAKSLKVAKAWDRLLEQVRTCLSRSIYSEGAQTMEQVVGDMLRQKSLKIGLAESCTGGLTTHRLTQVPGSSDYVDRGIVTYSNQAKKELLGVATGVLKKYGAVSSPVAKAMAVGMRKRSSVEVGVSITGIAGPSGGTAKKPVGLVFLGIDGPKGSRIQRYQFWGNRKEVQLRASQAALNLVRLYLIGL